MRKIVFYHDDLDGVCSAAVIRKKIPDVECFPVQHYYKQPEVKKVLESKERMQIFVVDFSFSPEEMKEFQSKHDFTWIDHHEGSMAKHATMWSNPGVKGLRGREHAACMYAWIYFFNSAEYAPLAVKMSNDIDLWKFEFPETDSFSEIAASRLTRPDLGAWTQLLEENGDELARKLAAEGKPIVEARTQRIASAFKNGIDCTFAGHKARMINSFSDTSHIGHYCIEKGYEVGVIWFYNENGFAVSFRSSVDILDEVRRYGGGGYQRVAGFTVKTWQEMEAIFGIKNNFSQK